MVGTKVGFARSTLKFQGINTLGKTKEGKKPKQVTRRFHPYQEWIAGASQAVEARVQRILNQVSLNEVPSAVVGERPRRQDEAGKLELPRDVRTSNSSFTV
ncbi:hypothetical protein QQ045_005446 [Rhodiola kirilowii]